MAGHVPKSKHLTSCMALNNLLNFSMTQFLSGNYHNNANLIRVSVIIIWVNICKKKKKGVPNIQ